jgi:LCP family protein required for cell wall assembly
VSGDSSSVLDEEKEPAAHPRRGRTLRVTLVVLAVLLSLVVAAAVVIFVRFDRGINTFSDSGLSKDRPPPTVKGQNILLIGSDSRSGTSAALGGDGSAVGRSDTTLFVHVYEGGRRAVAVSIPRDALVEIPPCQLPDGSWSEPLEQAMFNTAFSVGETPEGNPACTVNTVEKLTGMRVDHTVVADFAGFAAMTEIVGGVPVCLPNEIYQGDINPNLGEQGRLVFHEGLQTVEGPRALDYVRLRHGIGDGSDIGRMRRQQAFLGSVIAKVRAEGLTPTNLLPLAEAATEYLTVSPELGSAQKLLSFVMSLRNMAPEDIVFVTTPWQYDGPRVALVHPDVDRLWTALQEDEPLDSMHPAVKSRRTTVAQKLATVTDPVTVLNATSAAGLAAKTAKALGDAGVEVPLTANAPAQDRTVVLYGPGQAAQARALASAFVGGTTRTDAEPGLRLLLGSEHRLRDMASTAVSPSEPLPDSLTKEARSAATDPCTDLSYGADDGL